jgi:hypothetical protein
VRDLDSKVSAEALGLRAWLRLAQFLREVKDVLRQADDGDTAAPAGLLKEVVPPRDEILKFVLPEENRVGGFIKLCA